VGIQRILLAMAIVLVGGGGVVTGVSVEDTAEVDGPGAVAVSRPPKVTLSFQPAVGTAPVNPTAPISVSARDGELREVGLSTASGRPVKGELSADRRAWTAREGLAYGTRYRWRGTAVDLAGKTLPVSGEFSTLAPATVVRATLNLRDGRTVGVAAPIQLQFSGRVTDRAAAEKALSVRTSVPTEGSWGWLPDESGGSRVHWRPAEYWRPGTEVTVTAQLFGVDYGKGAFGAANLSTTFTIGRNQVTKADVTSHELVVLRDGAEVARYPASYGLDSDPDRNTRSGVHVITEKFTDKRMVSERYDYDLVEKWAVRMSNNGEFIHANPATTGVQGSANVSHGCVNLSSTDAKQYYDMAMYGDPVEVTGSKVALSARDGDIWIWTVPWSAWRTYSALDELN
jgi:lipoprotein-anchoring transpeptidase ErfK/SrfK